LEALRQISQDSEYDFSVIKKPDDYEAILLDGIRNTYAFMYELSPDRRVVDIPAVKYDFHNLKTLVKSKYIDKDMSGILRNITGLDLSENDLTDKDKIPKDSKQPTESCLPDESRLPQYIVEARDEAEAAYLRCKDPQSIDIVLDRHMFARMLALCEEVRSDFITNYMRLSIDFFNMKTMLRVKNMKRGMRFLSECLIPGGLTDTLYFLSHYDKTPDAMASVFFYKYFGETFKDGIESFTKIGNFSGLEKHFDNRLIDFSKNSKYFAFGPEVVFAYIISKENEIRQLRILLTCKLNGIRTEILKERLRDNYA